MIYGIKDTALRLGWLNDTWRWLEKDLTLVTVPDAGHFVRPDAADFVARQMTRWLAS
jgi:pimeloyl-ACP methyl ester carboxylesterase